MKYRGILLVVVAFLSSVGLCIGNDRDAEHKASIVIPDVALLSLQPNGGSGIQSVGVSSFSVISKIEIRRNFTEGVWLNYSSICHENQKRKVTAEVVDQIPAGVVVMLKAENSVGNGNGELGKSNGTIVLSNNPSDVISGIGSCYTGRGVNNGHLLSYQVEIDEDQFLQSHDNRVASVNVVYTLTDDN